MVGGREGGRKGGEEGDSLGDVGQGHGGSLAEIASL